jgi:hypothetical protein
MWLSESSVIEMRKTNRRDEKASRPNINFWPQPSARGFPEQRPVLGLLLALQPHHQEIVFSVAFLATGPKPVLIPTLPVIHVQSVVNGDTGNGSTHRVGPPTSVPPTDVPETPLYQLLE